MPMDPALRIFNVEGRQRTLDMPLVTPAQMAQKHLEEQSLKLHEDRAKEAIQQVNILDDPVVQIIDRCQNYQLQQEYGAHQQMIDQQPMGYQSDYAQIQQPSAMLPNPADGSKQAPSNIKDVNECSSADQHKDQIQGDIQVEHMEQFDKPSCGQAESQYGQNIGHIANEDYQYEKYDSQNIIGHVGPDGTYTMTRPNQIAARIFQTQKISLVEVEVSQIGQAEPIAARVEPSPEQLNPEVTRKNEIISEEICEAFTKISKAILSKTRRMLVQLKRSFLERVRLHRPLLASVEAGEQLDHKIEEIFVQCIKDLQNGYLEQKDKMIARAHQGIVQANEAEEQKPRESRRERGQEDLTDPEKQMDADDMPERKSQQKITNLNCASIHNCIKRIRKAISIQFEELLQNDTYKEEITEIEKECKFHLDLFSQDFKPLLKNLQQDIQEVLCEKQQEVLEDAQGLSVLAAESYYGFPSFKCLDSQAGTAYQDLLSGLEKDEQKNINCSIFDLFAENELKEGNSGTLLLSLLEIGNTIDGVIIGNKLLDRQTKLEKHNGQPLLPSQPLKHNFSIFLDWKQRQCHGCMEFIIEAGKAVSCVNLIREQNPCSKLFCQSCIIQSMEHKEPKPDQNSTFSISQSKRQKLWFKACQNILFMCPCCQNQESCFKSHWSVCSVQSKMEKRPQDFIHRTIYWYQSRSPKQRFVLAKIKVYNRIKRLFKIEILQDALTAPPQPAQPPLSSSGAITAQAEAPADQLNSQAPQPHDHLYPKDCSSQQFFINMQKEKFFFRDSIKNGSKLYGEISKDKYSIDIKKKIKVQIDDFQNYGDPIYGDYQILEKYANYLEKSDQFQVMPMPAERRLQYAECEGMVVELLKDEEERLKESEEREQSQEVPQVVHEEEQKANCFDSRFKSENLSVERELEVDEAGCLKKSAMASRRNSTFSNLMERDYAEEVALANLENLQEAEQDQEAKLTTRQHHDIKVEELEAPREQDAEMEVIQIDAHQPDDQNGQQEGPIEKSAPELEELQAQIEEQDVHMDELNLEKEMDSEPEQPPEVETIEQAQSQEYQVGEKNLRPRRQPNRGDFQETNQSVYHQALPTINDDQLEDINKQLERQFRKIDELKKNKGKSKMFLTEKDYNFEKLGSKGEFPRDLINFEERRREQEIEKRIDQLLKKKDEIINQLNQRSRGQGIQEDQRGVQNDEGQQMEVSRRQRTEHGQAESQVLVNNSSVGNFEDFKQFEMQIHHKKGKQFQNDPFFMEVRDEINFSRKHDDRFYLRRFKQSMELKLHCRFMKYLAETKPQKLIGLYVYVSCGNTEKDLWYRALVQSFDPKSQLFSIQHQNETKLEENVKLGQYSEDKAGARPSTQTQSLLSFMVDYNLKNEQSSTEKYINFNDSKVIERLQRKQHRMSKGEHHYALNQKKQPQELLEDHSGSEHSDIEPNSKRQRISTSQVDINRNLQEIVNEIVEERVDLSEHKKFAGQYSKKSDVETSINEGKAEKQKSTNSKEPKSAAPLSRYMIKKYSNLLDREFSVTNKGGDERRGKQGGANGDRLRQMTVAPKSLIFKANFDCGNEKIEEVKEHWVTNMKERNLRTKIKNKDHANVEVEKNSSVKMLKFYHQDIEDNQEEQSQSINISNKNEIAELMKQYQAIMNSKKNKLLIQLTDSNKETGVKVSNTRVSIPNSQGEEGESSANQHQQINELLEKINGNNQQEMRLMEIDHRQFNQQQIREALMNKSDRFSLPGTVPFGAMGMQARLGQTGLGLNPQMGYDGFAASNRPMPQYPLNPQSKLFDMMNNPAALSAATGFKAGPLMNPSNPLLSTQGIAPKDLFQHQQLHYQLQQAVQEVQPQLNQVQSPQNSKQQESKSQRMAQDFQSTSSKKRLMLRVQFDKERKAELAAAAQQEVQEQQKVQHGANVHDGAFLPTEQQAKQFPIDQHVAEGQASQQNMYQLAVNQNAAGQEFARNGNLDSHQISPQKEAQVEPSSTLQLINEDQSQVQNQAQPKESAPQQAVQQSDIQTIQQNKTNQAQADQQQAQAATESRQARFEATTSSRQQPPVARNHINQHPNPQLRGDFVIPQGAQGSQGLSRFQPSQRTQNSMSRQNQRIQHQPQQLQQPEPNQYQEQTGRGELNQDGGALQHPQQPLQQEGNEANLNNDVMSQFYQQYIQQGFRKCSCQVCVAMMYPVLIRRDADSSDFVSEHGKYCELLGYERGQIRQEQMNANENDMVKNEEMNMNQQSQMQPKAPQNQVNHAEGMNAVHGQQHDLQIQQPGRNNAPGLNVSGAYELNQPQQLNQQLNGQEGQEMQVNHQFGNHQMQNQFQLMQHQYQQNNQEQIVQHQYQQQQQYQHSGQQPEYQQLPMEQMENMKERVQMMMPQHQFEADQANARYQYLQQQNRSFQGPLGYAGGPMYVLSMPEQQNNGGQAQLPQYNGVNMPMYQQEFYDPSQQLNQGAGGPPRVYVPAQQGISTSLLPDTFHNRYHMNKMIYDRELQDLDYIRGKYIELHTKNQQCVMVPHHHHADQREMQNQLQQYQQEIKLREHKINEMYQDLSSLQQTLSAPGGPHVTAAAQAGYTLPSAAPNHQLPEHQPEQRLQAPQVTMNTNNHG